MIRSPPAIPRGRALPFPQDVQSWRLGRALGRRLLAANMSAEIILETRDLTKEFAGFVAVNGVNLKVERGTIHALIGPNGAGKTTCFNLLTKFLNPTRGQILYKGQDITAMQPADVARLGRGAVVSDFGGVSAPHCAGKCPRCTAAQTRWLVRFLALAQRADRIQ
jgi:ABC-type glutathione transport system ATPase component